MDRRTFVARCAGLAAVGMRPGEWQTPTPPQRLRSKNVLTAADFRYLGYFDLELGGEFTLGSGLTHRYVNGELRFLALSHATSPPVYRLREFIAPAGLGGRVTATSAGWTDIWQGRLGDANGRHHGLWWEEARERLWSLSAIDYPNDAQMMRTGAIALVELGASGTVASSRGLVGLEDVGTRKIYGGAVAVPAWFQKAYGVGPYAVGFGGYSSRMNQGLSASMGPVLITIPDPGTLADGANVASGDYKVLMDHAAANGGADWYSNGSLTPSRFDRGSRTPDYVNFYEGGTYPGTPGSWQRAPDGRGRWVWGDSAYQTGMWIDLPNKHGFVLVPTVHTGNVWYQNSTLNWNGRTAEFQVYDPLQLGEVAQGRRPVWGVKPTDIWRPEWQAAGRTGGQGNGPAVSGATFDARTNRVYVRWNRASGTWPNTKDRIFVWQVS